MHTRTTRRGMLVAATLIGAFVLSMLPPAMGADAVPPTVLRTRTLRAPAPLDPDIRLERGPSTVRAPQAAWTHSDVVCADVAFTSVGLTWRQSGDSTVPVLLSWGGGGDDFGRVLRTQSDPDHSPDATSDEPARRVGTPPVWTGEARCLRYSLELPAGEEIRGLQAVFINTSGTAHGRSLLGFIGDAFARAWRAWAGIPASAEAPQPAIISRAGWGADESLRNCGPDYADSLKMAYVHHTATGNAYSKGKADDIVRSIYAFHTQSRGFCDIAYNFLVDRYGRVYEGRAGGMTEPVIGGHAMGFNTGSTGVALIGNFEIADPTKASIRAVKRLLAWRLDVAHLKPTGTATMVSAGGSNQKFQKGESVQLPVISGHRQTGFTSCPGDHLWKRLNAIRKAALNRGLPKIWNPAQSTGQIEIGRSSARITADFSSSLNWTIDITRSNGVTARTWSGAGTRADVTWNGLDQTGFPAQEGAYTATISAVASGGGSARPASLPIQVTGGCDLAMGPGGGTLLGTDGPDVLCGGDGDDELKGMGGDDVLIGLGGNDLLEGGSGTDLLIGGTGNDQLLGGAGPDTLEGGEGHDSAFGGGGDDVLWGGPGNDALDGGPGAADRVSYADSASAVSVDLGGGKATGEGVDSIANVRHATGSSQGDRLIGDDGDNVLTGGSGSDVLEGGPGNDTLEGQKGGDRLSGGDGDDALLGQGGLDTADFSAASGPVTVDLSARTATGQGADSLAGIRNVIGTGGADLLLGNGRGNRLVGRGGPDKLVGRSGDDVLLGGGGPDVLRGGKGADILRGRGQADDLRGGAGADLLAGGKGQDTLIGGGGPDDLRARDGVRDLVRGGGGRDRAVIDRGLDRVRGVEQLR